MRLMAADTARYTVKRPTAQPDTRYVGTNNDWQPIGYVIGQLTPVTDEFTIERYGAKDAPLYSLICAYGANIRNNDRVVLEDGEYTVVALMRYSTHLTATLRKAGA